MPVPRSLLPVRLTMAVSALVLVSACTTGGSDPDDDSDAPASEGPSESGSTSPGPSEEVEESAPGEPDADSEVTRPGTRLQQDETAVIVLPDSSNVDRGLIKVSITLDAVTKAPLSRLPPGRDPGPSDLYFVEQTYTVLDTLRGNIIGTNLLDHTIVTVDGRDVFPFVDVAADPEGCAFADFSNIDEVGDAKSSCTAFLVPRGARIDEVAYRDNLGDYDFLDGEPVRWEVEPAGS